MRVYSVTYQRGRSTAKRYRWFADEREADNAMQELEASGARCVFGPSTHVVNNVRGLASILNEYAGDNSEF